jgi:hypothetical protein
MTLERMRHFADKAFGNSCPSRGLALRPHDRRRCDADLPDHIVSIPRHRACREPVRAQGARQHLYAHHESDQRQSTDLNGGTWNLFANTLKADDVVARATFSIANSEAACPEASARAPTPPSSAATRFSSNRRVGNVLSRRQNRRRAEPRDPSRHHYAFAARPARAGRDRSHRRLCAPTRRHRARRPYYTNRSLWAGHFPNGAGSVPENLCRQAK